MPPTHRAPEPDDAAQIAVLGPGLVGSYLGAAAGARIAYVGPSGTVRARLARLPAGDRPWQPREVRLGALSPAAPLLISTRVHQTPWGRLPADALAAQNGLGQPRPVITCFLALDLDADGAVAAVGPRPRLVLARPPRAWEPVLGAWRDAGLEVEVRDDAAAAQWEKAILNATVGPLCLATGLGMGEVWSDPALRRLTLDATAEGTAVAAAVGVAIPAGAVDRAATFFAAVGCHRPSVVRDPGELPHVLGRLLDEARTHGVPAPALERIAALAAPAARHATAPATGAVAGRGETT